MARVGGAGGSRGPDTLSHRALSPACLCCLCLSLLKPLLYWGNGNEGDRAGHTVSFPAPIFDHSHSRGSRAEAPGTRFTHRGSTSGLWPWLQTREGQAEAPWACVRPHPGRCTLTSPHRLRPLRNTHTDGYCFHNGNGMPRKSSSEDNKQNSVYGLAEASCFGIYLVFALKWKRKRRKENE